MRSGRSRSTALSWFACGAATRPWSAATAQTATGAGRDSLREITPTGESIGQWGTAKWWLIVMHSDGSGGICPGSGKRV